ncbi:hypothetical protein N0V88_000623 [Collariella sp. IMI 366227]|nr:hypothetical protein N0V88_000623 [Collariella sp. IMI 366227]
MAATPTTNNTSSSPPRSIHYPPLLTSLPTSPPSLYLDLEGVNLSRHGTISILQIYSDTVPKVFFDVRNDSDALFAHFGVRLSGVRDLQLMELAARSPGEPRRLVSGLAKCIDRHAGLGLAERREWMAGKEAGYEVFEERPLREEVRAYCVQDVKVLPMLWRRYEAGMKGDGREGEGGGEGKGEDVADAGV